MSIVAAYSASQGLPDNGSARAAILLLALGAEGAARILKHLSPDEIRMIRDSAASLPMIEPEQIDELVDEFRDAFKKGAALTGPEKQMAELLESALSKDEYVSIFSERDADPVLADLVGGNENGDVWEAVAAAEPAELAQKLLAEHPQMVAIIVSRIEAEKASLMIREFAPAMRNDIMRRILTLKPLRHQVQSILESQIRRNFLASDDSGEEGGSHAFLAEIVNRLDKESSEEIIESLRSTRPKDAEALEKLLFAFEDIPSLPIKSRLALFDAVAPDVLILALRSADAEMKEIVLSSLGARARRMAEAELNQEASIQKAEIDGARRQIAKEALRLAADGKIVLREEAE